MQGQIQPTQLEKGGKLRKLEFRSFGEFRSFSRFLMFISILGETIMLVRSKSVLSEVRLTQGKIYESPE